MVTRDVETQLAAGARAGPYEIRDRIAAGGFGTVYRAVDTRTGKVVAVKVMHRELVGSAEALARFTREVRAVQRLRHPNVAALFEVGELPGPQPFFAMELLAGTSLRERVRQGGRLSPAETLAVIEPVCAALAAAHELGIVHRDVKASNVFVTDAGAVVLLDFGIAKLIDDTGERITKSRQIVGSPPCMAPEQILQGDVDERADVYAVGVLIYELLTGALPFGSDNIAALCDMHLHAAAPPPSRRAPVGPALDEVVARAMAKAPADRYPSAEVLVEALRAAVAARDGAADLSAAGDAVAVHVAIELGGDPAALGDDALDAFESLLPRAAAALGPRGFRTAFETGDALLMVAPLPEAAAAAAAIRTAALTAAVDLERDAVVHPCVRVTVFVHVGAEAELLHPGRWLPDATPGGVFATEPALAAVDAKVADEPAPPGFRRLR